MRVIFCHYFCLSALLMNFAIADENMYQPSSIRSKMGLDIDLVIQAETQVTLIGRLTPATVAGFKRLVDNETKIKVVFIDSIGGDVDSAIEIATIIRNRKLNLVVDGRCFSACASYIFPSAEHKMVLPGSFVGIHEESTFYIEEGVMKFLQDKDTLHMSKRSSEKFALEKLQQLKIKEKIFYKQLAITHDLHNAYSSYVVNRKNNFGNEEINFESSYPNCPPIRMWALSKQQLISMGIKNIGDFWYPNNTEEKKKLSKDFKFQPGAVYFGEARDLEQVCKGISSSWIFRRYFDVKASILSTLNYRP